MTSGFVLNWLKVPNLGILGVVMFFVLADIVLLVYVIRLGMKNSELAKKIARLKSNSFQSVEDKYKNSHNSG